MKKHKQKHAIHLMSKSNDISLTELAESIGVKLSSLRVTLERENLLFSQFCTIYERIFKKEFESGSDYLDNLRNIYDLKLSQFIDILYQDEKKKLIVTLYKSTKIRIIN
jgi:hypothetical protein